MTTRYLTVDKKLVGVLEMCVSEDTHSFPKCCPKAGSGEEVQELLVINTMARISAVSHTWA